MEIKKELAGSRFRLPRVALKDFKWRVLIQIGVIGLLQIVIIFGTMLYVTNLYVSGRGNSYNEVVKEASRALGNPLHSLNNYVAGKRSRPKHIKLDVKFEDWEIIQQKHDRAVAEGNLFVSENPTVPARMTVGDKTVKVDMNLKGGADHFKRGKWSFRFEVDDKDDRIMGMTKFTLQHPATRFYLNEWVFQKIMAREGIIALNFDFVNLSINGKHQGIYALEEHFTKDLIERNERREGPILAFSQDVQRDNQWQESWPIDTRQITPYQASQLIKDEGQSSQFTTARSLLNSFMSKELSTCEVFDCEIMGTFFAGLDLLAGQHSAALENMKLYYNPLSSRLEPIAFDAETRYGSKPLFINEWSNYMAMPDHVEWFRQVFRDPKFMKQYLANLNRLSQKEYLDNFFAETKDEMNEKLKYIWSSYPTYNYNMELAYKEQDKIRAVLEARQPLNAYLESMNESNLTIDVGNLLPVPIQIKGISYQGERVEDRITTIPPLQIGDPIQHSVIKFNRPRRLKDVPLDANSLEILYSVGDESEIASHHVSLFPRTMGVFHNDDLMRREGNHSWFTFMTTNEKEKTISFKPGKWKIERMLIIPKGYTLVARPGTEIDFSVGAQLISYSPVRFIGSKDDPIVVTSHSGKGYGMAVLNAKEESQLSNVKFNNLAAPRMGTWGLTGATTFYKSPVNLNDVSFSKNRDSDDLLNLIHSPFIMSDTLFEDSFADALDADFSSGEIHDSKIIRAGNDGLDFSGSEVLIDQVEIRGAGDKGISAGERSSITTLNLEVDQARVGIASKDLSQVTASKIDINNSFVGLAVYQKKPGYGPASIIAERVTVRNTQIEDVIDSGSTLRVDDIERLTEKGDAGRIDEISR